jgi:hypothetical protein
METTHRGEDRVDLDPTAIIGIDVACLARSSRLTMKVAGIGNIHVMMPAAAE